MEFVLLSCGILIITVIIFYWQSTLQDLACERADAITLSFQNKTHQVVAAIMCLLAAQENGLADHVLQQVAKTKMICLLKGGCIP